MRGEDKEGIMIRRRGQTERERNGKNKKEFYDKKERAE